MQPAVFFGHGAPVYALWENPFTPTWTRFFEGRPRPDAIVMISAHWYGPGLAVTAQAKLPTIHDFGGFDQEFFDIEYSPPGSDALAREIAALLAPRTVELSHEWGIDHGGWTVLMHMWPEADIPVVQLRLDSTLSPAEKLQIGKQLQSLRSNNVAIIGSGNIVHNLSAVRFDLLAQAGSDAAEANIRFDQDVADWLEKRDLDALANYADHDDAAFAVPTPDHYLPLLVVAGAALPGDELETITVGPDAWSLSMRSIAFTSAES